MATVLQHKVVASLPSPLEPDSIYYVRVGQGFDVHVTNGLGEVVAYGLNAALGLQEHIGSGGSAHALATAESAGFMSPAHVALLERSTVASPVAAYPALKSSVVLFDFNPGTRSWTVPDGVSRIRVFVVGAGGVGSSVS